MIDYIEFEKNIGYNFRDQIHLQTALTHTSYANEHGCESFERLEFLGDSILGFVVAENLYRFFPQKDEGCLSRMRASLVCEEALSDIARKLDIPSCILLGVGEEKSGGRNKNSIISDVVEAIIAAIYKDSGFEEAKSFVNRIIPRSFYNEDESRDYKTRLQETFKHSVVTYNTRTLTENGVNHFFSEVLLDGIISGSGEGMSKKTAEQKAAEVALLNKKR